MEGCEHGDFALKAMTKLAIGALLLGSAAFASAAPAAARGYVGFSFGFGYPAYDNPCDYYDYYDAPPPWGLPPDYCEYNVFWEPVYWGGEWYRGPIYYRWDHGRRVYWLNGGWRHDRWHGRRPGRIEWRNHGGDHWRGNRYNNYRGHNTNYRSGHHSGHYSGGYYNNRSGGHYSGGNHYSSGHHSSGHHNDGHGHHH